MAHGLIAGPVVFRPVDLAVVQGRVHLTVHHLHRVGPQSRDHHAHGVGFLHTEPQPLQLCQTCDLLAGVEAAHTGIEPGKPRQVDRIQPGQKLVPDASVQHTPHLAGILIEERQLQHVQGRHVFCQLAQRDTGKVDAAELDLLDDAHLRPQLSLAVHGHLHPASGLLFQQVSKGQSRLRGGVILRLVLGVAQHQLRLVRSRFLLLAGSKAQHGSGGRRQHLPPGKRPAHSAASCWSLAALAACFRYWVGVTPVRFLKARAK